MGVLKCSYKGQVDVNNLPCGHGEAISNITGHKLNCTWLYGLRHGLGKSKINIDLSYLDADDSDKNHIFVAECRNGKFFGRSTEIKRTRIPGSLNFTSRTLNMISRDDRKIPGH